jgi:hypothetical protein
MTRQNKNLNVGFMIHLPSRPKRLIVDQWRSIFTVGAVSVARFPAQQPTVSKMQNSHMSETDSNRSNSKTWV